MGEHRLGERTVAPGRAGWYTPGMLDGSPSRPRLGSAQPAITGLGPYAPLLKLSLALGTVIGFAFGLTVLLSLAFRLDIGGGWVTLVQIHGQAQILGFVVILVMAVGSVLFPRFLASPLERTGVSLAGGVALGASVVVRAVSQPLPPSFLRSALLLAGGVLAPLGLALFAAPLLRASRRSIQPWQLWRSFAFGGFGVLMVGLLLGVWAAARLAGGLPLVPYGLNEAVIHLQLNGFAVLMVLGVGLKIFPQFLILQPPVERAFHPLLALYLAGLTLTAGGWLVLDLRPDLPELSAAARAAGGAAEFVALAGYVLALRLYERPARPSGRPHITNPTRRWFRLAFGWLLVAAAGGAFYGVREALGGAGAGFTEMGAVRHALAMGFLLPIIAGMAGRILPVYSADVVRHRWLLPTTVWLSFAGAFARVGGEWLGGYDPWIAPVVALGGILSTAGFLVMAVALWYATDRIPAST